MSRSHRIGRDEESDCLGKEFWKSRLHTHGEIPGRGTKILTHRKERRKAERLIRRELEELRDKESVV